MMLTATETDLDECDPVVRYDSSLELRSCQGVQRRPCENTASKEG